MKTLMVFLLVSVCPAHAASQILFTVGKSSITVDDFNRRLTEARKQGANPPTREEFLEDLIRLELAAQEAEKIKLQDDPAVRDQIKLLLYERYVMKKLGDKMEGLKVSEKELKDYYKSRPELRLAHIFIAGQEGAQKKAAQVLTESKKPKRAFEDLVREFSDDQSSKDSGGDIGFHTRMTLPSALYDAALGMKTGEIKGPIETPAGFYILKLLDRHSFDLADKHILRAAILSERRTKILDDFFDKTKKAYKVEVNREALKSAIN